MLRALRFQLGIYCLLLSIFAASCSKKPNEVLPPEPKPEEEVIPGTTVGYGATMLAQAEYEKIKLIGEPLIPNGRTQKDPKLPAQYDLSPNMPPVQSQGSQASCTAWATAYAARGYFNGLRIAGNFKLSDGSINTEAVLSPAFIYNQINSGYCTQGSTLDSPLELLKTKGVCTWKEMPYHAADCSTKPNSQQVTNASKFRISDWGRILIDKNVFKKFLYYNVPIIVAASINTDFKKIKYSADGQALWKDGNKSEVSGHAMVIVGYDDVRAAFKIQNSWGANWGNKGYVWMSYEILTEVIEEAYVMSSSEQELQTLPKVITEKAVKYEQKVVGFFGRIIELGETPVTGYGVCLSTKAELPTRKYFAKSENIGALPFTFSVAESINENKIWYRAFVETPAGVAYGDTASITLNNGPGTVNDKNLLLFHNNGYAYAVDADNGDRLWETLLNGGINSDAIIGGLVVNGHYIIPGNNTASLSAVSLSTGKLTWERRDLYRNKQSYPVNVGNQIVMIGYGEVVAVDQNSGNVTWSKKQADFGGKEFLEYGLAVTNDNKLTINVRENNYNHDMLVMSNPANGTGITGTGNFTPSRIGHPDFADNYMVRAENENGLAAYSLNPFKKLWTAPPAGQAADDSPLIVGSKVISHTVGYKSGSEGLMAADKATGKKLWEYYPQEGIVVSTKWSAGGNFVALIVRTEGASSGTDFYLHVLDIATGKLSWEKKLSTSPWVVVPMYPLIVGDKVYVSPNNSEIAVYKVQTGAVVWQKKFFENPVGISPFSMITKEGKVFYMPESGM